MSPPLLPTAVPAPFAWRARRISPPLRAPQRRQLASAAVAAADLGPDAFGSRATLAEPIGATLLSWALLGELPAFWFWFGAPPVLVGVWVAVGGGRPPAARRLPATTPARHR